MLCVCVRRN